MFVKNFMIAISSPLTPKKKRVLPCNLCASRACAACLWSASAERSSA